MSDTITVGKADLQKFATAFLAAAGVSASDAEEWAEVLIWANLRGTDSHGVMRLPRYLDLINNKSINPKASMRVVKRSGAIAVLDADRAPGPVAMMRAVEEAIARAREVHVGWCAARNITHAGAIGYYALKVAEAGMAGIVMMASSPLMAYQGARVAGVSTNPLAIAVPGKTHRPYLLDMSTSTVANGKILNARDAGIAIPTGWGIDAKGSSLSFMIECLASIAVGNPLIAQALASSGAVENPVLNGVVIAVDLGALGDADEFTREVDRLGGEVARLPRADGVERIFLPGERGDATLKQREKQGIPIPKGTWTRLTAAAKALGVTPPA